MLRCREVAERASLLIDDELGSWQRFNMRLHLTLCRGCRAFIAQMRIAHDLARMTSLPEGQDIGLKIEATLARRRSQSVGKDL